MRAVGGEFAEIGSPVEDGGHPRAAGVDDRLTPAARR